jgi:hypothetical protein
VLIDNTTDGESFEHQDSQTIIEYVDSFESFTTMSWGHDVMGTVLLTHIRR